MKKSIILSVLMLIFLSVYAKDIQVKLVNDNDEPVSVYVGVISSKDNYFSDEEIVQKKVELEITTAGRALKPRKKTQVNKYKLSNSQILIVFGLYQGGGRTEVFRYRVKDIDGSVTITFPLVKTYKLTNSYFNIASELKTTNNLGPAFSAGSSRISGVFVFYDVSTSKLEDVYVIDPKSEFEFERKKTQSVNVSDLIMKGATAPFMTMTGDIVRSIPENSTEIYMDITFPGMDKMATIIGENPFKLLSWNIVNSGLVVAKSKESNYNNLVNTFSETDKAFITYKLKYDLNQEGKTNYHLYLITSVNRTDTIEIFDHETMPLNEDEELLENDVFTPSGPQRMTGNKTSVYKSINAISDVRALDITPLILYRFGKEGRFANNVAAAANNIELYNAIGSYTELPVLDDKTLSISNASYTNNRIKEILSDPKILADIEAKLKNEITGPIPVEILKAVKSKLEGGKK